MGLWKTVGISLCYFLSSFNLSESPCATNDRTENPTVSVSILNLFDGFLKSDKISACSSTVNLLSIRFRYSTLSAA